jgi:hypothetical protein
VAEIYCGCFLAASKDEASQNHIHKMPFTESKLPLDPI